MGDEAPTEAGGSEAEGAGASRPVGAAARRPSRRAVSVVAAPLVALVVLSYVGDAMAPTLVDSHPAWLLALNPRTRNLVLITNDLDPWTYYGLGFFRLLISDPLFFLLGYWYGDAAVRWMERRTHTWGDMLRQVERWFGKAAYPLVFIAPNNYICLFAGAAGMPLRAFFALNTIGTLFRLYLVRRFGEAFESPIDGLVDWIGEHRVPLLIISVVLVVLSIALEAKRGETEVGSLANLDEELGAEDDDANVGRDDADAGGDAGGDDTDSRGDEAGPPTEGAAPPDHQGERDRTSGGRPAGGGG